MKAALKQLSQVRAKPAVSIFVKTHRTHPENEQDPIALKNQLKAAEDRLTHEYDKRTAQAVMDKIHAETNELNPNYNLDTLAIFATTDQVQVLRLPFDAKERVVIGEKFATRDLTRHLSQSVHYYILVLTTEVARLIEAVDTRLVKEIDSRSTRQEQMSELTFPISKSTLPIGSKADRGASSDEHSYLSEFMNRVDKSLQQFRHLRPLPVILVGDARTMGFYEQVCDNPAVILGKVDNLSNLRDGSPEEIIQGVQALVDEKRNIRYDAALGDLEKARNDKMVRTDLQQIYRSAVEGSAVTLLVRQGYAVPALIDDEQATLLVQDDATAEGVTDDAVSEVIEIVAHNGGEVVFIPQDKMDDKEPIALITRY